MEPEPSDQPPKSYRFTLAKLLAGVTIVSLLFGIVGVPVTLYLAAWLTALGVYFGLAQKLGPGFALLGFLLVLATLLFALETMHLLFP